jgi:hypothetical protein
MLYDGPDFCWWVHQAGYRWVEGKVTVDGKVQELWDFKAGRPTDTQLILSPNPPREQYWARSYFPMKEAPGLFRNFAELSLDTDDDILKFANKYGQLGIPAHTDVTPRVSNPLLYNKWDERRLDWKREISSMKAMINLWDMVKSKDHAGLERHLILDGGRDWEHWVYLSHPEVLEAARTISPEYAVSIRPNDYASILLHRDLDWLPKGDLLMRGSFLVQQVVNNHLSGGPYERTRWHGEAAAQLCFDRESGTHRLQFMPKTLLGAMWLQFARAIDGDRKYRACKECGTWFEVSTADTGFRVNRLFCSDACKSKDYRDRKARVGTLKAEGRSIKEIAKELDTDVETIARWVGAARKRKK